jgi:inosine-uridine nucleoside N-ribohydrolase
MTLNAHKTMMKKTLTLLLMLGTLLLTTCTDKRVDLILDTDANNELDDQHAITYLLMHWDEVNIVAITTNATYYGGDAEAQAAEARRIVGLMGPLGKKVNVIAGATADYEEILPHIGETTFDGSDAVNCIIASARRHSPRNKLLLVPVGKLTNIALALAKAPDIVPNVRIVWLGSNYPQPGEYNLENDIPSVNAVIDSGAAFEMAIVASSEGMRGTAEVGMTRREMVERVAGKGPRVEPIEGRAGGTFTCVGDYLLNLFEQCSMDDNYYRSLFDMAALATALYPDRAEVREIPAPILEGKEWKERPMASHTIKVLFNFNREAIIDDFVSHLDAITE